VRSQTFVPIDLRHCSNPLHRKAEQIGAEGCVRPIERRIDYPFLGLARYGGYVRFGLGVKAELEMEDALGNFPIVGLTSACLGYTLQPVLWYSMYVAVFCATSRPK
jgi:hypothetical protein